MQDICVRFVDGGRYALGCAFDVNVGGRLPSEEKPKHFVYTDTSDNEAPIYLRLDQVVANTGDPGGDQYQRGVGPAGPPPDYRMTPDLLNPAA